MPGFSVQIDRKVLYLLRNNCGKATEMNTQVVNQELIERINKGDEKAFDLFYDHYFVYLCSCANAYIFNPVESQDIVNEIFIRIWCKRGELTFPIHTYLLRSVQNGCLNYLRSLHNRERILDEYRKELLEFQEEYCAQVNNPLGELEMSELEDQVKEVVAMLPEKCRMVFEQYLYVGLSPREIAERNDIAANTVRVHIKNAMDKVKEKLGHRRGFLLCFLF